MLEFELDILWEVKENDKIEALIAKTVEAALIEENVDCEANISFVITDNDHIQSVNFKHRDKDMVTDVLSFPGYEKDEWEKLKNSGEFVSMGDIVISVEKVDEQADRFGHSFDREFCYLIAHGMLHLMGYDHMEEADKVVMREKEEKILAELDLLR